MKSGFQARQRSMEMAEPSTLPIQEAPIIDEKNGSLLHALRGLLSLSAKESKKQLRSLSVSKRLELLDLVRASLSVADDDEDDQPRRSLVAGNRRRYEVDASTFDAGAFDSVPGQYVAVANEAMARVRTGSVCVDG